MDYASVLFLIGMILIIVGSLLANFILGFKITYYIVTKEREQNEKDIVKNVEKVVQSYLTKNNDKLTKEDEAE